MASGWSWGSRWPLKSTAGHDYRGPRYQEKRSCRALLWVAWGGYSLLGRPYTATTASRLLPMAAREVVVAFEGLLKPTAVPLCSLRAYVHRRMRPPWAGVAPVVPRCAPLATGCWRPGAATDPQVAATVRSFWLLRIVGSGVGVGGVPAAVGPPSLL